MLGGDLGQESRIHSRISGGCLVVQVGEVLAQDSRGVSADRLVEAEVEVEVEEASEPRERKSHHYLILVSDCSSIQVRSRMAF